MVGAEDKQNQRANEQCLMEFRVYLEAQGLSERTLEKHVKNIDFFLNEYLVYEVQEDWNELDHQRNFDDPIEDDNQIKPLNMEDGCEEIGYFIEYFFLRKCLWSSPASIQDYCAAFKKFYFCMLKNGHISKSSYDVVLETIKNGKSNWIREWNSLFLDS